jgi:hypothetical protein
LPLPIAEFLFGANGRHRVARPRDTPIWRAPGRPGGFSFASRKRFASWTTADALAALQVLLRARHFALSGPRRSKKPKIDVRELLQAVGPDRPRPRPHLDAL